MSSFNAMRNLAFGAGKRGGPAGTDEDQFGKAKRRTTKKVKVEVGEYKELYNSSFKLKHAIQDLENAKRDRDYYKNLCNKNDKAAEILHLRHRLNIYKDKISLLRSILDIEGIDLTKQQKEIIEK